MLEQTKSFAWLAGRVLLSHIFILSGVMKIIGWTETANGMADKGMPLVPVFLSLAIAIEIGAGLSVLLGYRARLGALALALFLVPVTLVYHNFWGFEGQAMMNQMQHFMKNLTIMGGLWTLVAVGAGPYSLDDRLCCSPGARQETTGQLPQQQTLTTEQREAALSH